MKFECFKSSTDLVNYAYKFIIEERLPSLQKDVKACLNEDCAFPALLYCFSTIDLLGALCSGYASESSHTKDNFKHYVCLFMKNGNQRHRHEKYSEEHADLIQEIFRHKIVYLAQPRLVISHENRLIGWRYEYPETLNHLKIKNIGEKKQVKQILTPYNIYYDHIFVISITQFMLDIIDSVLRERDGYFAKLKSGYKNMQIKFDKAIKEIYD